MSENNGLPEPREETQPEELEPVVFVKKSIDYLMDDESLTLLERFNALEELREYIGVAIAVLQDSMEN